MATDFLGRGWAFPLGTDSRGGVAMSQSEENVKESIRIILGTAPGERDMRPDFGCWVWNILFDDVDASFAGSVERLVEVALRRWEPRIEVKKVKAQAGEEQVLVDVGYPIRATNREDNLVFPFYRGSRG